MMQTKTLPFKLDTPRVTLRPRAFVYTTPDIPFSLFISVAFFQGNPKKNPSPIWHRRNRPGFFAGGPRCACAKLSSLFLFFFFFLPTVGWVTLRKGKKLFFLSPLHFLSPCVSGLRRNKTLRGCRLHERCGGRSRVETTCTVSTPARYAILRASKDDGKQNPVYNAWMGVKFSSF